MCVPYIVLLAGTVRRLSAGNLSNVALAKTFMDVGYDGVTDVYVGVYDDLAKENFASRLVGWGNATSRNVKLCYLVIDEFHNFETETYRSSQLDKIRTVRLDAFEKVVLLSGTAPPRIADPALRKIGFRGLEGSANCEATALQADGHITPLQASCIVKRLPTKLYDLVTEVPLGHVYEEVKAVADPYRETFRLLKALFACEPNAKAVVVVGARQRAQELADDWEREFRVMWTHAKISIDEKVKRAEEFLSNDNCQVLVGTKLVTEGMDVSNLRMVIMLDYWPSIIEIIQAAGRLRSHGLFYILKEKLSHGDGCLREQMAQFYGLQTTPALQLPAETRELLVKVNQALGAPAPGTITETSVNRKRVAVEPPHVSTRRKIMKQLFHEPKKFENILLHIGIPAEEAQCLFLYGVGQWFRPAGVFTNTKGCQNCRKDRALCVCPESDGQSYVQIATEALALRRMLMDDKEYSTYLDDKPRAACT